MASSNELLASLQTRVLCADRTVVWPDHWPDEAHKQAVERTLAYNVIYYIVGGIGGCEVDDQAYPLRPGTLVLLPAKHFNRVWTNVRDPIDHLWITFDARFFGKTELFELLPCPAPLLLPETNEVRPRLEELVADFRRAPTPFQALAVSGCLSRSLAAIFEAFGEGRLSPEAASALKTQDHRVVTALNKIALTYHLDLDLDQLAEVAHLHRNHLVNLFKKATGMTPMAYLQHYRVERARDLLRAGIKVAEGAGRVGFPDPFHFSRLFKRVTGISPKGFQESLRER